MESPKKASVKHIEFQLQREKALTRDLDARCKAFQAQIAQLEQDKAELRREKLSFAEDAKKLPKLDERAHALIKDIEGRDAIINQLRASLAEAKIEIDAIRHNANTSIASWKVAEAQWISEQSALNDYINEQEAKIANLQSVLNQKQAKLEEAVGNLKQEYERAEKINKIREQLDKELLGINERLECLQNRNFELDQNIYQLNLERDQMKESLDYKDTEIKTLEARIAKHLSTEEKLEQMINSLNDRINSARMINLEGKSENEKLLCDIADARKENQRLVMQMDALKRDLELGSQSQAMLQRTLDDLREKYQAEREDLKERNLEVRKHELTISQLTVEIKKSENQCAEWSFRSLSMETELRKLKEEARRLKDSAESYLEENIDLKEHIQALKVKLDRKDEEVVLTCSQLEDRIESLTSDLKNMEKQVMERQEIINDLTNELGRTNEKNAVYHNKILEESEAVTRLRNDFVSQFNEVQSRARDVFLLKCMCEKQEQAMIFLSDIINILCTERSSLLSLQLFYQCELRSRQKEINELVKTIASCEDIHSELQVRVVAQSTELQALQEKLVEQNDLCLEYAEEMTKLKAQATTTHSLADQKQKIIEKLNAEIFRLEKEKQAHGDRWALELDQEKHLIAALLYHEKKNIAVFDEKLCSFDECIMVKVECYEQAIIASLENAQRNLREEGEAKQKALLRCKEMAALIEEIKGSNNKDLIAATEKQNTLHHRIETLENQLQVAKNETKHTEFHLNALLLRFESEQKAASAFKKESHKALKSERVQLEKVEKENQKLRDALEYEIKRKCEYKEALEELKRLREEGEGYRRKEKDIATEAIKAANEEARYWVECFDKLKTMVETSRQTGTRIPSVDPDTCSRLESVKSRISEALQPQNVNQSIPQDVKYKRQRIDFCE
ncbi:unnamed protein product [Phytomonas sp. EM1]|nr:unnamed protein product [Phytomonas sp. EM1]|eukprot:CCW64424.1 unnamed protein product [Phytomonas sp. isolate EM1]